MTIKLVRSSASKTEMSEIVLPSHANNLGTVFGGVIMQWVDACAAMAAQRHCRRTVVTAAVDELRNTRDEGSQILKQRHPAASCCDACHPIRRRRRARLA